MKKILLTASAGLCLLTPAFAVSFDTLSFGEALNGWRKNRTASYSIDNHSYLTHKPTITPNTSGGLFVSTRVEHRPKLGRKTTSYIELSYSSHGTLLSAQLRIMAGGKQLNTGLINRPAKEIPKVIAEGEVVLPDQNPEPWLTPERVMVTELFKALDTEFTKLAKVDLEGKKDVFSRVFGKSYQGADLAAALRHNLNLMMKYTR